MKIHFLLIVIMISSCKLHNNQQNQKTLDEYFPIFNKDLNSNEQDFIIKSLIVDLWSEYKSQTLRVINGNLIENKETVVLYNIELYTINILLWAKQNKNYEVINEILELLLRTKEALSFNDQLFVRFGSGRVDTVKLDKKYKVWIDGNTKDENILNSSQFCYFIAKTLNIISQLSKKNQESIIVTKFIQEFCPLLQSHYYRWVFSSKNFELLGWGCDNGYYNHYEFMEKQLNKSFSKNVSYCNAITDTDLWIIAGVAEMLATDKNNENYFKLNPDLKNRFNLYIKVGSLLLESRTKTTQLKNFKNKEVKGKDFDIGVWDDHPGHEFYGYFKTNYPELNSKKIKPQNTSWDISHASRFYYVFSSLFENREILDISFPDKETMQGFANQVAYKIFNGDFNEPKFNNYFNGSNGWYRVRLKEKFGYAPYQLSMSYIYGGYPLWAKYNDDINTISNSVLNYIYNEKSKNDAYSVISIFIKDNRLNYNSIRDNLQFFTAYSLAK